MISKLLSLMNTAEKKEQQTMVNAIHKIQAVIEFNMDGTIITANQNFLSVMDYRLEEIQNQHHSLFVEPDYAKSAEYQQFWDSLRRGQAQVSEFKRIGKNNKTVWIQASYNPVYGDDGKPYKVIKFATDITDQMLKNFENKKVANISQALKICQASVMMADNDLNIVYINDNALNMFKNRERDIQKHLPSFDSSTLIGTCVDDFHKQPSHQRRMLSELKQPYETSLGLGDLTFKLVATPWVDGEGTRLGTIIEWNDRTFEVAIESEIDNMVEAAATGNFTKQIALDDKEGFFKTLGTGLNNLVSTVEVALNDVLRVLGTMAKGDLTERITRDYEGTFGQMKNDVNSTADKLTEVISNIRGSSLAITSAANEIAQGNADLSQRTEEQASSLEETASSMEQMTSAVKQSAENAIEANRLSSDAQDQAKQGGSVVSRAVSAMEEINDSSKKISDIIGVIDEIAFQTNLLALNAAVEAARAGEQGRGFAVVAGEVRNLAQRSAGAAKEIKELIRDSQNKVGDGTKLVNESGETLKEIVTAVEKVSSMMKEISEAAQEQTSGIEQVNTAVSQMDDMTQQNASLVEEATAAGEAMAEQARSMNSMMDFFIIDGGGTVVPTSHSSAAIAAPKVTSSNAVSSGRTNSMSADEEWEEF